MTYEQRPLLNSTLTEEIQRVGQEIISVGDLLWQRDMVASNDGNISARLSNG